MRNLTEREIVELERQLDPDSPERERLAHERREALADLAWDEEDNQ